MEADQGVEDQEARPDALYGLLQALAVVAVVKPQDGHVDDGDVEGLEVGAGRDGDAFEPAAHDMGGVLGGEQQDRSGLRGSEVTQAWDAGRDGDRDIEGEEGFSALGLAADDADGLLAP